MKSLSGTRLALSASGVVLPGNLITGGVAIPAIYDPYPVSGALSRDIRALDEA